MKLAPADIKVGKRFRKTLGDIDALVESIKRIGLLHPVVVDGDHRLIAGFRRLKAWKKAHPKQDVPVYVAKSMDGVISRLYAERDENVCREDMENSEATRLGLEIEALEKPAAKERQREGGKRGGKASGKVPEASERSQTRDKVGEAIGMSGKTWEKAKTVVIAADENPEKFGDLPAMMDGKKGSVAKALTELEARGGKQKKKKPPKHQRIEKLIRRAWAEAKKDVGFVDMLELRACVRDLYIELLKKDPPK
jgi:ParB family chromosome partitioning protein